MPRPRSLEPNEVRAIRRKFDSGKATIAKLAKEYAVHYATVRQIVLGDTYQDVK